MFVFKNRSRIYYTNFARVFNKRKSLRTGRGRIVYDLRSGTIERNAPFCPPEKKNAEIKRKRYGVGVEGACHISAPGQIKETYVPSSKYTH